MKFYTCVLVLASLSTSEVKCAQIESCTDEVLDLLEDLPAERQLAKGSLLEFVGKTVLKSILNDPETECTDDYMREAVIDRVASPFGLKYGIAVSCKVLFPWHNSPEIIQTKLKTSLQDWLPNKIRYVYPGQNEPLNMCQNLTDINQDTFLMLTSNAETQVGCSYSIAENTNSFALLCLFSKRLSDKEFGDENAGEFLFNDKTFCKYFNGVTINWIGVEKRMTMTTCNEKVANFCRFGSFPTTLSGTTQKPSTIGTKPSISTTLETLETTTALNIETTVEPTESPTTEEPTVSPTIEEVTESPTTEEPIVSPTTEEKTESPTTEQPTESPTTEEVTESPTTEESTESPTTEGVTEFPTTEESTESPATEEVTESPTTEETTEPPATGWFANRPWNKYHVSQ